MKFILYLSIICFCNCISYAEKVPAGYVAKWDTLPLTELDYKIKKELTCQSFEGTLLKGKLEQPHIRPFKIVNNTLQNFINGYKKIIYNDNISEFSDIDIVVIWPNYEQSNWYVLMGNSSCFIKWIELQPDNIDSIISSGKGI